MSGRPRFQTRWLASSRDSRRQTILETELRTASQPNGSFFLKAVRHSPPPGLHRVQTRVVAYVNSANGVLIHSHCTPSLPREQDHPRPPSAESNPATARSQQVCFSLHPSTDRDLSRANLFNRKRDYPRCLELGLGSVSLHRGSRDRGVPREEEDAGTDR